MGRIKLYGILEGWYLDKSIIILPQENSRVVQKKKKNLLKALVKKTQLYYNKEMNLQ